MWLRFRRKFQKSELQAEEEAVDMTIKVEGMSCQHCVANVKHALESVDQVNEANPDLSTRFVKIKGGDLDISKLTQAVESAGYKVVSKRH